MRLSTSKFQCNCSQTVKLKHCNTLSYQLGYSIVNKLGIVQLCQSWVIMGSEGLFTTAKQCVLIALQTICFISGIWAVLLSLTPRKQIVLCERDCNINTASSAMGPCLSQENVPACSSMRCLGFRGSQKCLMHHCCLFFSLRKQYLLSAMTIETEPNQFWGGFFRTSVFVTVLYKNHCQRKTLDCECIILNKDNIILNKEVKNALQQACSSNNRKKI